ncbi:MAG TPA: hypothetical protein PLD54_01045, partial [Candidatus Levybacteria bacterium]|nr:hypothetical protein [Candidatus Levybacteria bacterium]
LVVLAIRNERRPATDQQEPVVLQQDPAKTAEIIFSPNEVVLASNTATTTVDIIVDTKEYEVDGVQLELMYDPEVLTNVTMTTPEQNFFGGQGNSNNFINEVDPQRGRVSYWFGINPMLTSKQGTGVVAQLSFTLNPQSSATETVIDVLDKSMITEIETNKNVLAAPSPLNITIVR